jgi:UrcA family protein
MPAIKTLIASLALAATAFTGAASAQEFTFNYESWQLRSAEGRAHVLDALERRVDAYCDVFEARSLLQARIAADCQERTLASALEQLGDPRVFALHHERERRRSA